MIPIWVALAIIFAVFVVAILVAPAIMKKLATSSTLSEMTGLPPDLIEYLASLGAFQVSIDSGQPLEIALHEGLKSLPAKTPFKGLTAEVISQVARILTGLRDPTQFVRVLKLIETRGDPTLLSDEEKLTELVDQTNQASYQPLRVGPAMFEQ